MGFGRKGMNFDDETDGAAFTWGGEEEVLGGVCWRFCVLGFGGAGASGLNLFFSGLQVGS